MPGMGWLFGLAKELGIDTKNKSIDQLLKEVNAKKGGAGKAPKAEKGEEPKEDDAINSQNKDIERGIKEINKLSMPKEVKDRYIDEIKDRKGSKYSIDSIVDRAVDVYQEQYSDGFYEDSDEALELKEPDEDWDKDEKSDDEWLDKQKLASDVIDKWAIRDAYNLEPLSLENFVEKGKSEGHLFSEDDYNRYLDRYDEHYYDGSKSDEDWDSGEIPEIEPYSEKDLKQDFAEYEEMISAGQYNDAYHLRDYILKQAKSAGMEENEMLNKLITEEGDVVWESPKDSAKVEKDVKESSYTQDDLNTDFREWQDAIRNGETGKAAQLRDYILDNAEKAGMKAGIEIQSLAENKASMEDVNRLNASRNITQPASQAPKQSTRRDFLDTYAERNDLNDTEYDIADSVISELEEGYDGDFEDLIYDGIDNAFIYDKNKWDLLKENYTPQDLSSEIVQQAYMDFTDDVMEIANKLRAGEGEDNAYFDSNLSYDGRMLAQDIIERIDDFENVPEDELYDRIIDSFNDSIIYYDDQWKILEDYTSPDDLMDDNVYENIFDKVYGAVADYQEEQKALKRANKKGK